MPPERHRELAAMGGRAARDKNVAHRWTSEEAKIVGAKGGRASRGGRGKVLNGG